jgi:secreted trypsin-like serine protease
MQMPGEPTIRRQGRVHACAWLSVFALFGCGANPPSVAGTDEALIGGTLFAAQPAIGAVLQDGGRGYCTGTLIAPRRVLTAAHCLFGEDGVRYAPARLRFAIGPDFRRPSETINVAHTVPAPAYDPSSADHDVGVLVLASDASVAPLSAFAKLNASWIGTPLLFVGYGSTTSQDHSDARKRAVSIPIRSLSQFAFRYGNAARNTCWGDSGGPALYRAASGELQIAGVTSWGDEKCASFAVDARVDTNMTALDF